MDANPTTTSTTTAPTTVGDLLAEEYTMDPSTPLPSFLEMMLAETTSNSGRAALASSIDAAVSYALAASSESATPPAPATAPIAATTAATTTSTTTTAATASYRGVARLKRRLTTLIARIGSRYGSEIALLITFGVERSVLARSYALASESVYGMKRARATSSRREEVPVQSASMAGGGSGGANGRGDGGTVVELGPLSPRDLTRSALLAALVPYAKDKLDRIYERERERRRVVGGPYMHGGAGRRHGGVRTTAARLWDRLLSLFTAAYPYLHMSHEGVCASYRFLYLIGRSAYYSPSLHALGIVVRRVTQADLQQQQQQQQQSKAMDKAAAAATPKLSALSSKSAPPLSAVSPSSPPPPSSSSRTKPPTSRSSRVDATIRTVQTAALVGISSILVAGWLAHLRNEVRQRRRRWIAGGDGDDGLRSSAATAASTVAGREGSSNGRNVSAGGDGSGARGTNRNNGGGPVWSNATYAMPPPQPPKLLDASSNDLVRNLPTDNALCPICRTPRVNPAASTSGHVFCYRCIVMHVRDSGGWCPLTGLPCLESNIVRLYEPTGAAASTASASGVATAEGTGLNE